MPVDDGQQPLDMVEGDNPPRKGHSDAEGYFFGGGGKQQLGWTTRVMVRHGAQLALHDAMN
jgi:hypothetical protein